ncbi:lecithin retinol acyltransferase family protein [Halomonas sp. C05BenzN]|uniref:lecithin retinol acyltransferase family protein n=1 Tax=Halomonas sp. C05BenzN TaxID=3411041 RepID=UPI003B941ABE
MGLWDMIVESWEKACEEVDHPKLSRGSVLRIELTRLGIIGFDHYGIYAGNKKVIHFSGGRIRKESLDKFIEGAGIFNGGFVEVMSFSSSAIENITLEESYQRAKSCVGMAGYDVLDSNCEHFALWCRTGEAFSGQAFGSESELFDIPTAAMAANIPRMIGSAFNRLGMQRSREISISGIVDV